MKTVKYCDAFEAELFRGRLESEGIQAVVLNDLTTSLLPWSSGTPYAAVQVAVAEENYEHAMTLLAETDVRETDLCCPECGSENVAYGFWHKKGIAKKLFWVLTWVYVPQTITAMGCVRNGYTCRKCGYEFKP